MPLIIFLSIFFIGCKRENPQQVRISKEIYLTFDDGPSKVTCDILSVLSSYNVKATFFVVGKCVEKNPQILNSVHLGGHGIGIHSYSHEYKSIYKDIRSLGEDISYCENAIKRVIPNFKARLYRFPGGSFNLRDELKNLPSSLNLRYFDWNASVCDAEGIRYSPEELAQNAIKTSYGRNRIILLCHDCGGKTNTALALPYIIEYFKNEGYIFKRL